MPDQLYNILFNPNHEMPSITIIIVILALVLITNAVGRYMLDRKDEKRRRDVYTGRDKQSMKKTRPTKKKK